MGETSLVRLPGVLADPAVGRPNGEIVFSHSGTVTATTSPKWFPLHNVVNLFNILISAGTAGTTASTISLKKNGTLFRNITIPVGSTRVLDPVVAALNLTANTDYLTITATPGTGLADLTVQVRYA